MNSSQFEIKLGVNSSGVVTGVESAIGQFNKLITSTRNFIAGFGIASLIKSTVTGLIEWGAEIQKTARANGLAADTFQEISAASKELSIDLGDSTSAFKKLQLAQVEALKGNVELQRAFQRRGISVGRLREMGPKQLFDVTGESFAKAAPSAQATADAIALMGKTGVSMMGAFRGGFMDAMRDARALGEVLSDSVVQSLVKADDAMTRFGLQAKVAIAGLMPPLIELTSQLLDATQATGIWLKTWWKSGGPGEASVKNADAAVDEFFKLKEKNARAQMRYENPKAGKPENAANVTSNSNAETMAKPVTDNLAAIGGYRGGGDIARIPSQQLQVQQRMEQHLQTIAHYAQGSLASRTNDPQLKALLYRVDRFFATGGADDLE